jgi:hypothetical protein
MGKPTQGCRIPVPGCSAILKKGKKKRETNNSVGVGHMESF